MTNRHLIAPLLLACLMLPACSSAYYGAWETLGYHKRDILVERVESAKDSQEEAKEQFASALDQFKSVVNFDGGELEAQYKKLDAELQRSESRAGEVTDRIESVESVGEALFNEWEKELDQYSDAGLRRKSEDQMKATRRNYDQMVKAMHKAESKMEPVLKVFRDQVLFLKHNLNAQALASLEGVAAELDDDVAALIADMQASIDEANEFIKGIE